MSNNFLGPFSHFRAVSHPLSRIFERGFRLNHTVHFRHLAFLLTSLINPFGISNYAISNFYYAEQFSRSFQLFWAVSHPLSRIFERGFRLNHTVHFRHLAFLLTSLINPFGISNYAISNFYYAEQFSRSFQLFWAVSHPLSRIFE